MNSVDNGLHQPDVMRKLVALNKKKTMDMTFHLLNQFSTKACTRSDSDLKIKINNNQCGNSINSKQLHIRKKNNNNKKPHLRNSVYTVRAQRQIVENKLKSDFSKMI